MSFIKKRIKGLIIAISGMFFLLKNEDSIKVQSLFFLLFIFLGYYFEITTNAYFGISNDLDIGKVDENYLYETLLKMDLGDADALFISCTALPALSIIEKLEKKLNKVVLSSNQVLIWDTLQAIGKKNSIYGFGKLFLSN